MRILYIFLICLLISKNLFSNNIFHTSEYELNFSSNNVNVIKEKKINDIIDKILENKLLKEHGLIILHRHKSDDVVITQKLNILDIRVYGISRIIFGN